MHKISISFATIDLSIRTGAKNDFDPRYPAYSLTTYQIDKYIPDTDDGLLWGAYFVEK
jgi:hypothetical protein